MPQTRETASSRPSVPARPWHALTTAEVEHALGPAVGLDSEEVARRLVRYGPNIVEVERQKPWWRVLLHQFHDPLIYTLLAATALTLALGEYKDSAVILAVLVINAAIGFSQEIRARAAIRGLARLAAPRAQVVRNGETREVPSHELVPGDLVLLASGVRVPADLRLVAVRDLEVDESTLTGESVPARKTTDPLEVEALVPGDRTNMAFAGTMVTRGRARGIAVETGASTELGRIAAAVHAVDHVATPLEEKTERLGRWIGLAIVVGSIVAFAVGLARDLPPTDIFMTVVALAVAVIPEGLPVVLTVTLAVGVRRMARKNAIIRALPAVETLGATTIIGSDKTGTLTKNEMTVRSLWADGRVYEVSGTGYQSEGRVEIAGRAVSGADDHPVQQLLLLGVLANEADAAAAEATEPKGDPTEIALHVSAIKGGLRPSALRRSHVELDLLPFEPERRFMATLNRTPDGGRLICMKGAPEAIFERCHEQLGRAGAEPIDLPAARDVARSMAAQGLRVLAMAYRHTDADRLEEPELRRGFVLAGLQGMEDPVRPEAVAAIDAAREAGIRVLMMTGDHLETARAVGVRMGLATAADRIVSGHEIDPLTDDALDRLLNTTNVYARVAPEHKLRLVQRLMDLGHVVAVTGDGVNDAPALRAAHLGIAMGRTGTDVAREASDLILADDNFATITAAVEEGRLVFSNIRKVTFFLLSTGTGMLFAIMASLAAGFPLPFLPAQILWINLVTSGIQDVTLALEPGEPGLLRRPPRSPGEAVVTLRLLERVTAVGLVLAAGTLSMFWWTLDTTGNLAHAQSVAMTQMVVFQFFHAFNSRSLVRSVFRIPLFSNPYLFGGVLLALIAHLSVLYLPPLQALFRTTPLTLEEWAAVTLVATTVIAGGELDKEWSRRRGRHIG